MLCLLSNLPLKANLFAHLKGKKYLILLFCTFSVFCHSALSQAPANDNCANPIVIPATGGYGDGTTIGATPSMEGCAGESEDDVWYKFTPAAGKLVTITVSPNPYNGYPISNLILNYFQIPNCPSYSYEGVCENDTQGSGSESGFFVSNGNPVYFRIFAHHSSGNGRFLYTVTVKTPPANDECTGAFPVTVNTDYNCGSVTSGTLSGATESNPFMSSWICNGTENDDVWFKFVATSNIHKISILNEQGGSTNLRQALFKGSTANNCNDMVMAAPFCLGDYRIYDNFTIGETYYIRVFSFDLEPVNTTFDICVSTPPPPPANDNCSGAIPLIVNNGPNCNQVTAGTVAGSTASPQASACGGSQPDDDVWFSFVATYTRHRISLLDVDGSDTNMYHELWKGAGCSSLFQSMYNSCSNVDVSTHTGLTIGETYYIRVYTLTNNVGQNTTFNVCVSIPPPPNDECANATVIPNTGGSGSGTTAYATESFAGCFGYADDDVWYRFTPASGQNVTITATPTATGGISNILLNAFQGADCPTTATPNVACGFNFDGLPQTVSFISDGSPVRFRVYSYFYGYFEKGAFTYSVTVVPPPANDNCSGAYPLTVNNDFSCSNVTAGTVYGATASPQSATACGGTEDDDVWFSFVATATTHRISILNVTGSVTDLAHSLWTGADCNSLALVPGSCGYQDARNHAGLTIGQTYYVRVYTYTFIPGQNTTFNVCVGIPPPPPANDNCAGAYPLTVNSGINCSNVTAGTVLSATASPQSAICGGTEDDDVWFSFVATATTHRISLLNITGSNTDMYHSLWTGAHCNSLALVPGSCSDADVSKPTGLTIGQTYYIRVYTSTYESDQSTTFNVCVSTPVANDDCSGAYPLTVNTDYDCGNVTAGTVLNATASSQDANACLGTEDDDVWFSFVATATTHRISILNAAGSSTDLYHSLWTGADCNSLALVPGSCSYSRVRNTSGLTIGQTYYVRVYTGTNAPDQNTTFDVCVGTLPPPPANDDCSGAIALTPGTTCNYQTFSSGGATGSTGVPAPLCAYYNGSDVWFTTTADANGNLKVNTNTVSTGFTDGGMAAYSGSCGSLTLIECDNNDSENGFMPMLDLTGLSPNQVVYIRVWDSGGGGSGQFSICATIQNPQPANDNCTGAYPLTVTTNEFCGSVTAGTVANATASPQSATACFGAEDDDVWFSFVATATTHRISILNVTGSVTDLAHSLWTGADCNSLALVPGSCSDPNVSNPTGLTIGQTYYVRVYTYTSTPGQNTTFNVCVATPPPPPANDNCSGAIALTPGTTCNYQTYTNAGATASGGAPAPGCAYYYGGDVWFTTTADANGNLVVNSISIAGSFTDGGMAAYSGSCGSLTLIECDDDDSENGLMPMLNLTGLSPNQVVYIRVWEYGGNASGSFGLCAVYPTTPPVNDNCSGAIPLTVNSYLNCSSVTAGTVSGATASPQSATACSGTEDDDVWFSFVATATGHRISILNIAGSATDMYHSLWTGADCNSLALVPGSCSDADVSNHTNLTIGQTYYVRVYTMTNSTFQNTTFNVCVESLTPPPANDDCSGAYPLTVNSDLNCGSVTAGTVTYATASPQSATACGGTEDDDVWFSFVATTTTHRISILNITGSATNMYHSLWTGADCNSLALVPGSCSDADISNPTDLTIGQTYYVRVYTWTNVPGQNTSFDVCVATPPPPPGNDNCSGAYPLTVNNDVNCGSVTAGTVLNATASLQDATACNGAETDDVWFSFVATATSHRISILNATGSHTGLYHSLWAGANCASLALVPGSCSYDDARIHTGLTIGQTYYVRVYTWTMVQGQNTSFDVCVATPPPPPANDNCSGAYPLTVNNDVNCSSVTAGTVYGATASPQSATACSGAEDDDVWFSFVATATTHRISILNVTGSATDMYHSLWTGADCNSLALVPGSCNDANVNTHTNLTIGQTYYVRVYTWTNVPDQNTSFDVCVATPPPPPANDNCSGAYQLTVNTDEFCGSVTAGTVYGATASPQSENSCIGFEDDDVWFSFVATATSHRISILNPTGSSTDLYHSLWTGADCNSLALVPGSCSYVLVSNPSDLTIGQTYYIRVYTATWILDQNTSFNVCVGMPLPPPANNNCSGAYPLTVNADYGCGSITAGTVYGATTSPQSLNSCYGTPDDDVWFSFVATATTHRISLLNITGSDTYIIHSLWTGADCNSLTIVPGSCTGSNMSQPTGLTIGQSYYIRVYTYTNLPDQTTSFDVCVGTPPPPPANDNCSGAYPLTVNSDLNCSSVTAGTVAGATSSFQDASACNGTADDDVWFSFVATATTHRISLLNVTGSATYMVHSLWTGADCNSLSLVPGSCSDAHYSQPTGLTIGQTYYIRVYTVTIFDQTTTFDVCVATPPPPPANDDCSGAYPLTVNSDLNCGSVTAGTVYGATGSPQDANACGFTSDDDVWFSFVATATTHRISLLNVTGSSIFMAHSLWTGADCNSLSLVPGSCNNTNMSQPSGLTIGQTYYIRVYTWYVISDQNTTFNVCVATPPPPPANDNCSGAYPLTVNADAGCSNVTAGTVLSATASPQSATACNGTEDDDVWFSFVATANTHRISLLNITGSATDMYHSLWTGADCNTLALVPGLCSSGSISEPTGLSIGQTYYLRVYTWTSYPYQNTSFDVCVGAPPPPPSNDNCSGAYPLTVNADAGCSNVTAGTVYGATASPQDANACYGTADDDVWFSFVATATTHRILLLNITGSATDMYHSLWTGADCNSLAFVPGSCSSGNMSEPTGLTIGQTYYLRVYTWTNLPYQNTSFDVCVAAPPPPPPNDNCSGAIALTPTNPSATGNTIGATESIAAQECGDWTGTADDDVWYTFNPLPGEIVTITVLPDGENPIYDAVLIAYQGACPTSAATTPLACSDNIEPEIPEELTFTASNPAQPIYYRVYSFDVGNGTFTTGVNLSALPIKLSSFTGIKASETLNKLQWNVSCTDDRPNTIELQRSNTNGNFTKIYSVVTSPANCGSAFDYNDAAPLNGNNYYRLKMVDADGVIKYSHVVLLNNSVNDAGLISLSPNPAKDVTTVRINSLENKAVSLSVIDATGRTVVRQNASLVKGTNNIRLDVSRLSSGMYQVLVSDKTGVLKNLKLSKQ